MRTEIQTQDYNLILTELKEIRKKKSIYNLKSISRKYSKYISTNYFYGNPMMSLVEIINYITTIKKTRKILFNSIVKWFSVPEKLHVDSTQSIIYLMELKHSRDKIIDIILKIDRKSTEKNSYREYFITLTQLNKLRYYLPNFMMTYGQFKCIKPSVSTEKIYFKKMCKPKGNYVNYTLYERIVGISLETYLTSYKLKYENFINCFVQLLFALEKAQEECGFTHFDLHYDNIILKESDISEYDVYCNGVKYTVEVDDYIPVIIDYGHACVKKYNGNTYRYIGYGDFPEHGMMNFIVPGYDMYKIMYFCIYKLDQEIQNNSETSSESKKIFSMFKKIFAYFYGKSDPYSLFENNELNNDNLERCMNEYGKMATFSTIGNKTPMELIQFLVNSKVINIQNNFQRNPVPFQSDQSSFNILTEYTNSEVVQPKCVIEKNINLLSLKKYVETVTQMVEKNNDIHEHVVLSLIDLLSHITTNDYDIEKTLLKSIPYSLELLKKLCEFQKDILNINLSQGLSMKLNVRKWKKLKKIYNETRNLFQLYYMIKYNHEHGSNFNVNLHFSLEKKWNELSQLSRKILRWYDSLVYYQFTKYNNDKKGIFNNHYFEQFEIFIVQKNIKTPWKWGNLF
jgi:hypothetical protein